MQKQVRYQGLSLIELLVVIAIIAILMGLSLPAIQKVRASSAASSCQNNMRQLGIAALNYNSEVGKFPSGSGISAMSAQMSLLPYLEQAAGFALFDQGKDLSNDPANYKVRTQTYPVFLCPSDTSPGADIDQFPPSDVANPEAGGRLNYYVNAGTAGIWWETTKTFSKPKKYRGMFAANTQVTTQEVEDGLSNTVLMAEIRRAAEPMNGPNDVNQLDPTFWSNGISDPSKNPNNYTALANCNDTADPNSWGMDYVIGLRYYQGWPETTAYTHTLPPNYSGYACMSVDPNYFHIPARSFHRGGVNVVFVDGSVHFINDAIDPTIWQALGTRAGNEVIPNDY